MRSRVLLVCFALLCALGVYFALSQNQQGSTLAEANTLAGLKPKQGDADARPAESFEQRRAQPKVWVQVWASLPDGTRVTPHSCSVQRGSEFLQLEPRAADKKLLIEAGIGEVLSLEANWRDRSGSLFEGNIEWVVADEGSLLCVIPLESPFAIVRGKVTRESLAVASLPVFFSDGKALQRLLTNDSGFYEFRILGSAEAVLKFGGQLAPEFRARVQLTKGEIYQLDVALPSGAVTMEFLYPDGNALEEGYPVTFGPASLEDSPIAYEIFLPRTLRTNSLGMVKFQGLEAGEYLVEMVNTMKSRASLVKKGSSPALQRIVVSDVESHIRIVLPRLTTLRVSTVGILLDFPAQKIRTPVWIAKRNEQAEFRPFAKFSSSVAVGGADQGGKILVSPGEVLIRAGAYPFGFAEKKLSIKEGEEYDITLQLDPQFLEASARLSPDQVKAFKYLYFLDDSGALVTRVTIEERTKSTNSFGGKIVPVNLPIKEESGGAAYKFGLPGPGTYTPLGKKGNELVRFRSVTIKQGGSPILLVESE
jgi:hypothetical protein